MKDSKKGTARLYSWIILEMLYKQKTILSIAADEYDKGNG